MKTWHYIDAQRQQASAPENELESLVQRGVVTPGTLVWTTGQAGWLPARDLLPQLFTNPAAVAPPPPPPSGTLQAGMKAHDLDFEIIGDDIQIVEIELDPGETVIAEAGAMNYMEADIQFETRMGDGS